MFISRMSAVVLAATALAYSAAAALAGDLDRPFLLGTVPNVPAAIDEMPAPPKRSTAPQEPGRRQSETWLIGEDVLPPVMSRRAKGEKITIHGQHDMPTARTPRIAGSPTRR